MLNEYKGAVKIMPARKKSFGKFYFKLELDSNSSAEEGII